MNRSSFKFSVLRTHALLVAAACAAACCLACTLFAGASVQEAFADGGASGASASANLQAGQLMSGESASADDADAEAKAKADAQEKAKEKAARERAAKEKAKLKRKVLTDGLYNIASSGKSGTSIAVKGESRKAGAAVGLESRELDQWAQKWIVVWDSKTGYYRIRNLNSRKFLTVSGTIEAGSSVKQSKATSSKKQLWEPVKVSGKVVFKSAGSKLALAAVSGKSGASLQLKSYKKAKAAQQFKLRKVDAVETDRSYLVRSADSGLGMHVVKDSRSKGAKIELAKATTVKSQKFRLLDAGSSGFRIQGVRSQYYLGAAKKSSKTIQQFAGKSGANKKWNVELDLQTGTFTIGSDYAGKQLDATSGKLRLRKATGEKAQRFVLTPTYAFKLYLNPGHGANDYNNGAWDTGAVGSGHTEAEFTHDLAHRIEKYMKGTDVKVINGEKYELPYWRRMPKAVALGCDAIVSIHFDVGGAAGTHTMVGVQGKAPGSDKLNKIIRKRLLSSLGLYDMGTFSRSDITCVNGPIPSMLMEVCFMDNYNSVQTYLKRRGAVAKNLAKGIVEASRNRSVVR